MENCPEENLDLLIIDCFLSHLADTYDKIQKTIYNRDEKLQLVQKYEKVYAGIIGWFSCLFNFKPDPNMWVNVWNLYLAIDSLPDYMMLEGKSY